MNSSESLRRDGSISSATPEVVLAPTQSMHIPTQPQHCHCHLRLPRAPASPSPQREAEPQTALPEQLQHLSVQAQHTNKERPQQVTGETPQHKPFGSGARAAPSSAQAETEPRPGHQGQCAACARPHTEELLPTMGPARCGNTVLCWITNSKTIWEEKKGLNFSA